MKSIIAVFLCLSLLISGLMLQITIADLDMSEWDFIGSSFLVSLMPYLGLMFMVVGGGLLILFAKGRKKK